ncbi:hypothetical protein PMIN02_011616 [Paraphaeosphaeria minitans]
MGKPGEGVVLDVWHTVLNGLYDGPAGKILLVLDRHAHRPAHIQVISQLTAPGYMSRKISIGTARTSKRTPSLRSRRA